MLIGSDSATHCSDEDFSHADVKVCARVVGGRITGAPCKGDSGGPLVTEEDGKIVLVGTVHAGTLDICGDIGSPVVFVRTYAYLPWIKKYMANSENCPLMAVKPEYYQDGICDDGLNTPECNYDGGDCCLTGLTNPEWNQCCMVCFLKTFQSINQYTDFLF